MTPAEFRHIRRAVLELSQEAMARLLGISPRHGDRTIRRWEDGSRDIPGPVVHLMRLLRLGKIKPGDLT